jgi:hypothetical protein
LATPDAMVSGMAAPRIAILTASLTMLRVDMNHSL